MNDSGKTIPSTNLDEVTIEEYAAMFDSHQASYRRTIANARLFRIAAVLGLYLPEGNVQEWGRRRVDVRYNDTIGPDKILTILSTSFIFGGDTLTFTGLDAYGEQVSEYGNEWIEKGVTITFERA